MSWTVAAFIIGMSFLTSALSGVFGMAGGLALKGALAFVLPVSATFVTHGVLQLVANGWRAILHRRHVVWRIVGRDPEFQDLWNVGREGRKKITDRVVA